MNAVINKVLIILKSLINFKNKFIIRFTNCINIILNLEQMPHFAIFFSILLIYFALHFTSTEMFFANRTLCIIRVKIV